MSHISELPYIYPQSPDPYLKRLGGNKAQAALARLAHLNPLIDKINEVIGYLEGTATGIVAFPGGGQTDATQLTATFNEVTTVASAGDSVKLLPAIAGTKQTVKNDGANDLAVFPSLGDTIDDGTPNASITIAPGCSVTFEAISNTNWETTDKAILVAGTLFVDAIYGNDSTAHPYNPAYPYATIAAALAVAISGELIYLTPGTHSVSTNILKDGVNFYADKGVTIKSSGNLFNADTTAGGTTLKSPFFFLGNATLNDNNAGGGGYIQIRTNPSANITLEFDSVNSQNISNSMVIRDGILNLLVRGNYTSNGRSFNLRDTGNLFAEVWGTVTCNFASNFNGVFYSSGMSWDGMARIKAKTFSMPTPAASQAVITAETVVNGDLVIELDYYTEASGSTYRFLALGTGTTVCRTTLNVKGHLNTATRPLYVVADTDHTLFINAPLTTCAGATNSAGVVGLIAGNFTTSATFTVSGGTTTVAHAGINGATSSVVPMTITSGEINLLGAVLTTDGSDESINQSGGTINVAGAKFTTRVSTSAGTLVGSYVVTTNNTQYLSGPVVHTGEELRTGPGAINLTDYTTRVETTGAGDALTIADGVDGQEKFIYMNADAGDGILTPANSLGFTTITFNDEGDSVHLQFNSTAGGWLIKGFFGVTIA
jgi:hypothetical protein